MVEKTDFYFKENQFYQLHHFEAAYKPRGYVPLVLILERAYMSRLTILSFSRLSRSTSDSLSSANEVAPL